MFDYIEQTIPVIAILDAESLPYGDQGLHAVVVKGMKSDRILYIDPALGKAASLSTLDFFKSWDSRGRYSLVIQHR